MPLTPFQEEVAQLLSVDRSPDSYLAGGAAMNIAPGSERFSNDLDYFHDSVLGRRRNTGNVVQEIPLESLNLRVAANTEPRTGPKATCMVPTPPPDGSCRATAPACPLALDTGRWKR